MTINVTKKNALDLFLALAFFDAKSWDETRMNKRLEKLPQLVVAQDAIATAEGNGAEPETLALLRDFRKQVKANPKLTFAIGAPVEVAAPAEKPKKKVVEQTEHPVVTKAVENANSEKAAKVAAEPKKVAKAALEKKTVKGTAYEHRFERLVESEDAFVATGGLDKFGFRKGTMAAVVNAKLTKSWRTTDELVEGTNVARYRVTDHMWKMLKHKFAEKRGDGQAYRLTEAGLNADYGTKGEKKADKAAPAKSAKELVAAQIAKTVEKAKAVTPAPTAKKAQTSAPVPAKKAAPAPVKKVAAAPAKAKSAGTGMTIKEKLAAANKAKKK